jgi:hypothetical protein
MHQSDRLDDPLPGEPLAFSIHDRTDRASCGNPDFAFSFQHLSTFIS